MTKFQKEVKRNLDTSSQGLAVYTLYYLLRSAFFLLYCKSTQIPRLVYIHHHFVWMREEKRTAHTVSKKKRTNQSKQKKGCCLLFLSLTRVQGSDHSTQCEGGGISSMMINKKGHLAKKQLREIRRQQSSVAVVLYL